MKADVVIIGAGASGLMAAFFAAKQGADVLLMDKNQKAGRKLRITGKGRCNLTNDCEAADVLHNIPGDGRFLYSALTAFPPHEVMRFFEGHGLALKTERGHRVFPVSDNANDVADLLVHLCKDTGVRFCTSEVKRLIIRNDRVCGVETSEETVFSEACIVCTGGLSYPLTGSSGDGYRFAKDAGHTVSELRPSLVPLVSPDPCCERMQGLSLKNVALRIYEDGKPLCREQGEMLFTHFGISGPLVLSASARMRRIGELPYRAEIDLKPALDEQTLDRRLLRDLKAYRNRSLRNALADLLPHTMIPELLKTADLPEELPANALTKEMRHRLLTKLKAFPLTITGTRPYAEAIVTAGGVKTTEVNPRSMQSKLVHGLFFAGELLDLDAYTGGYNLQIAWSTGRLAGISAGKQCMSENTV